MPLPCVLHLIHFFAVYCKTTTPLTAAIFWNFRNMQFFFFFCGRANPNTMAQKGCFLVIGLKIGLDRLLNTLFLFESAKKKILTFTNWYFLKTTILFHFV